MDTIACVDARDHLGLAMKIALKYRRWGELRGMGAEDLEHVAVLGLLQAIRHYDPGRGVKFATFAFTVASRVVMGAIRRQRIWNPLPLSATDDGERDTEPASPEEPSYLEELRGLLDLLPPLSRALVERHYGLYDGRPWTMKQLARDFDMSAGQVDKLLTNALRSMRRHAARTAEGGAIGA